MLTSESNIYAICFLSGALSGTQSAAEIYGDVWPYLFRSWKPALYVLLRGLAPCLAVHLCPRPAFVSDHPGWAAASFAASFEIVLRARVHIWQKRHPASVMSGDRNENIEIGIYSAVRWIEDWLFLGAEKHATKLRLDRAEKYLAGRTFDILLMDLRANIGADPIPSTRSKLLQSLDEIEKLFAKEVKKNKSRIQLDRYYCRMVAFCFMDIAGETCELLFTVTATTPPVAVMVGP